MKKDKFYSYGWTFYICPDVPREQIEERIKLNAIEYLIKKGYIKITISDDPEPCDNDDGTVSFYKKAGWKLMKPIEGLP